MSQAKLSAFKFILFYIQLYNLKKVIIIQFFFKNIGSVIILVYFNEYEILFLLAILFYSLPAKLF